MSEIISQSNSLAAIEVDLRSRPFAQMLMSARPTWRGFLRISLISIPNEGLPSDRIRKWPTIDRIMMSIFFVSLALLMVYAVVYRRLRRGRVGSAAAGTVYDLLNEDRRKALEIIVEEKAAATDPETKDGQPSH